MIYYEFGKDFWFLLYPIAALLICILSGFAFIHTKSVNNGHETLQWGILCVLSGFATVILWGGISDYVYFRNIYTTKTYHVVTGTIERSTREPENINICIIHGVTFRNSPRQMTSAFKAFDRLEQDIGPDAIVRIAYAKSYWMPSDYAILRIELLEPEKRKK